MEILHKLSWLRHHRFKSYHVAQNKLTQEISLHVSYTHFYTTLIIYVYLLYQIIIAHRLCSHIQHELSSHQTPIMNKRVLFSQFQV